MTKALTSKETPLAESVNLSCLSPDDVLIHSFNNGEDSIISRFLPLHHTSGNVGDKMHPLIYKNSVNLGKFTLESEIVAPKTREDKEYECGEMKQKLDSRVAVIKTKLPEYILQSLKSDPAIELVCIDNDTPVSLTSMNYMNDADVTNKLNDLPLLCLYNSRSAYVIYASYKMPSPSFGEINQINGHVIGVIEPFESHLLESPPSTTIVRIRPAPNGYINGGSFYSTLCPRGSMAMLTSDSCFVLYHGISESFYPSLISPEAKTKIKTCEISGDTTAVTATILLNYTQEFDVLSDFVFLPSVGTIPSSNSPVSTVNNSNDTHNAEIAHFFNAMTVVLCTYSGKLYALTPVVFHGGIFPRTGVIKAAKYLEEQLRILDDSSRRENIRENIIEPSKNIQVQCRKIKAAKKFLIDAFGGDAAYSTEGYYLTANILGRCSRCATTWPISIQGPLYNGLNVEDDNNRKVNQRVRKYCPHMRASCMEIFTVKTELSMVGICGIVLADEVSVNYIIIPGGTTLLPRFAFENKYDAEILNKEMDDSCIHVECITFDIEDSNENSYEISLYGTPDNKMRIMRQITLKPDPLDGDFMYHVSLRRVIIISSNVMQVFSMRAIQETSNLSSLSSSNKKYKTKDDLTIDIKTNAWTLVETSCSDEQNIMHISSVAITGEAQLGHVLFVQLSNGSLEAFNMTAAQYLHHATASEKLQHRSFLDSRMSTRKESSEKTILEAMESIPALHVLISPILENISKGLSGMAMLVGGKTNPRNVTAGTIATFLDMKQKCENDIVLPLHELNDIVARRLFYLREMDKQQKIQFEQLSVLLNHLKEKMEVTSKNTKLAELNMDIIAQRSAGILEATRDLLPTITVAEREYFSQLKHFEVKFKKWTDILDQLHSKYSLFCKSVTPNSRIKHTCYIKLGKEQIELFKNMLDGQDCLLKRNMKRLSSMDNALNGICTFKEKRSDLYR